MGSSGKYVAARGEGEIAVALIGAHNLQLHGARHSGCAVGLVDDIHRIGETGDSVTEHLRDIAFVGWSDGCGVIRPAYRPGDTVENRCLIVDDGISDVTAGKWIVKTDIELTATVEVVSIAVVSGDCLGVVDDSGASRRRWPYGSGRRRLTV